jgi:hypothetical protein
MWQSVCSSYCSQLNAASLVCYCECGSQSVPATAVSWLLSVRCVTLNVAVSLFQLLQSTEWCQFRVLLWMWQSVCSSYCSQLNAVSFSTALHAALYRSIYHLLNLCVLGKLQGILGALQNSGQRLLASSCPILRPSVFTEQHVSKRRISIKFDIWVIFEHLSITFNFSLSCTNNNRHCTRSPLYICNYISLSSF